MAGNAVGESLFASVARDRPEWVAQGLFAHALVNDAGVRRFMAKRLFPSSWKKLKGEVPKVDRERPYGRWRADVVATWGKERWWFELKLASGLTYWQAAELGKKARAAIVYPRGRRPKGLEQLSGFTWDELARAAADKTLGELLGQVNATASWWRERITKEVLDRDFESFLRGDAWEQLYRFLSTVDAFLEDHWGSDYRPSKAWAVANASPVPYYGYSFDMKGQKGSWFLLAFSADNGMVRLTLDLNSKTTSKPLLKRIPPPYSASVMAGRVRRAVEKARGSGWR